MLAFSKRRLNVGSHQDGNTAMIEAVIKGYLPGIEYLVDKGADIEARGDVSGRIVDTLNW